MKIRGKGPRKPRNPLVVLIKQRKAGTHAPTLEARRQKAKPALQKRWKKPEQ